MGIGLAGVEVPIAATDSVQWIDVSVPTTLNAGVDGPSAPPTEDCGSCFFVGLPEVCIVWRIQKNQPHVLELFHLSPLQDSRIVGLRLAFSQPLSPFAFICSTRQIASTPSNSVLLYALTVSGVAYMLKISDDLSAYSSSSVFPHDELVEIDVRAYSANESITSVAATPGCLLLGRNDGSTSCFQLGLLNQNAPGFMHELQDDSGLGRLWGLMSRGKIVGAVRNLALLEVHDRRLLFVLHSDEIVRAWDLSSYSRLFSHAMFVPTAEGSKSSKLWVGQPAHGPSTVPLAILYKTAAEVSTEILCIYRFHFVVSQRMMLTLDSVVQNIPLEEGGCIDVKLTSDKIWILKDSGLVYHSLSSPDSTVEEVRCYASQEEFVADQLCQSAEHSLDDLISMTQSIFSSTKDRVVPLVSSILMRRFLHSGVLNNIVLRSTFLGFNKHWTDSEFRSLTADGLKKEIILLVEQESIPESTVSSLHGWRSFCSQYFHNWCRNNGPCGLFVHSSTGLIGLVRKSSVSLYRGLENVEVLIDGALEELSNLPTSGLDIYDDSEREVLFEVLRCVFSINQQLGRSASTIFYESFVGKLVVSSEEIISHLLKILETGYGSSIGAPEAYNFGSDVACGKRADHKIRRKFSVDMLLSIHALIKKAVSWDKVLSVIENYLQVLVPQKVTQNTGQTCYSCKANGSVLVQASGQIAKIKLESALDILLFISYLVKISAQIGLSLDNISRVQLDLVPMIQEIVSEWLLILFLATTPSELATLEDFNSQLSSLRIDGNIDRRSQNEKFGKCDFPLASVLLLNAESAFVDDKTLSSGSMPNPQEVVALVRILISWIIWGKTGEESSSFLRRSADLAIMLLSHGQYSAVECLLDIVESNSQRERIFRSIQETSGDWCLVQHLLGCCLLAQTQHGLHKTAKERKACEAIQCFFRASSGEEAPKALQSLSVEAGLPYLGFDINVSSAAWKLHYYQWVMRLFEKYSISEGACQFALCALEQVDEALAHQGDLQGRDPFDESAITIKGRLWGDVFKFTLDLNLLSDAYCAIISNPDEESKYLCLRRFVRVLCERGAIKILCGGLLPFVGLTEKIEQELSWKAEHSSILAKPNLYKLLYAFEMNQHNWRSAARYIYLYSARLRTESVLKDQQHVSLSLQERLNGLSAAINALNLVHPAHAWISIVSDGNLLEHDQYPSKKAKTMTKDHCTDGAPTQRYHHIGTDELEREHLLTTAEYFLSLANVRWTYPGTQKAPSDVVALLVQMKLYDLAFTVLLKFWKGTGLQSELEKVFSAMSLNCCSGTIGASLSGKHGLLLTSSKDEVALHGSPEIGRSALKSNPKNSHWETLELYLGKYKTFHSRLPVVVAETILHMDPQIELPLWLVDMFKNVQGDCGMAGLEPSPASLFQLYVDYGKYVEAAYLFLEYVEAYASMRPIKRKKPFAVWFPYTTLERMWCQLEGSINSGHMGDQYDKVRKRLHAALLNHLKLLKIDSDDAVASAIR